MFLQEFRTQIYLIITFSGDPEKELSHRSIEILNWIKQTQRPYGKSVILLFFGRNLGKTLFFTSKLVNPDLVVILIIFYTHLRKLFCYCFLKKIY